MKSLLQWIPPQCLTTPQPDHAPHPSLQELIDPALLRPGRFEVQVEIGLPDEDGRRAIFDIHMKKMVENGLLHPDVDMDRLVSLTPRYSGAEIAGLVRSVC